MSSNLTGMGYKKGKLYLEFTTPEHTACNMWDSDYECDHECEVCSYSIIVPKSKRIYTYNITKKKANKFIKEWEDNKKKIKRLEVLKNEI